MATAAANGCTGASLSSVLGPCAIRCVGAGGRCRLVGMGRWEKGVARVGRRPSRCPNELLQEDFLSSSVLGGRGGEEGGGLTGLAPLGCSGRPLEAAGGPPRGPTGMGALAGPSREATC